jgi:hypothetical protein
MYKDEFSGQILFISPLMSLYWFFDARRVIGHSLIIDTLRSTMTTHEAMGRVLGMFPHMKSRPRRSIPYP